MTIDPPTIETSVAMSAGGAEAARPTAENSAKGRREDPYRDFELYLEKVQDELSEVFEQWEVTGSSDRRKPPDPPERISSTKSVKLQNIETNNGYKNKGQQIYRKDYNEPQSRNGHRKERLRHQNVEITNTKAEDAAWSEGIVAEVNSIIFQQLRVLEADERNDASSTSSSTFTKTLEIREPRDQYTQTTPNSLSPTTSSVTWPSEYSLYDTCKDGTEEEEEDVDNKSTTASCSSSASSYNDEAANSKDELSCECLGSADSLDVISTSSACNGKRCWLRMNHGIRNPSIADDAITQPSSAENLLTDSRSEEVDSGIGILSDADKIHNGHGHRTQSRMTGDIEEAAYYDDIDDEGSGNKRTIRVMMELGTKSSSDPVLKTRNDEDRISSVQEKKKSYTLSNQELPEIEVIEACKWLKAAGFPQYAQMYEELPFPVDLSKVKEDHPFLDPDSLRSLYRRLGVLNRCALLRLDVYQQRHKLPSSSADEPSTSASTTSTTSSSSGTGTGATSKHSQNSNQQSSKGTGKQSSSSRRCATAEDSDDEDNTCALSEAWTYQSRVRRWSRVVDEVGTTASTADDSSVTDAGSSNRSADTSPRHQNRYQNAIPEIDQPIVFDDDDLAGAVGGLGLEVGSGTLLKVRSDLNFSSNLSDFPAAETSRGAMLTVPRIINASDVGNVASRSGPVASTAGNNSSATSGAGNFQRTNSERIRDGAKALLRHVESFKTRHRKRHHRDGIVIGDPLTIDPIGIEQKLNDLHCVDIPTTPNTVSKFLYADDTSSYCSEGSQSSINGDGIKLNNGSAMKDQHMDEKSSNSGSSCSRSRRFLEPRDAALCEASCSSSMRGEDSGALSDSDCHQQYFRDANSNHTNKKECSTLDRKTAGNGSTSKNHKLMRSGSLTVKTRSDREREREELNALTQRPRRDSDSNAIGSASRRLCEDFAARATLLAFGHENPRMRWHSFQDGEQRTCARPTVRDENPTAEANNAAANANVQVVLPPAQNVPNTLQIVALSCGQLQVLRKLALVTLTGYMEKYCPTHRTGWNWELPKFIRKTKTPDYKDKVAFGVPLAITMQRTGHALPKCIQKAIHWLQTNALEQVGLFRKSGVKSRIQSLKQLIETYGDEITFEGQQAYDVADVVKQYFRELPEALLTNKLSETFIAIFQDVPECKLHDALSCALLLLPDEHREALQTLLEFLGIVAEQVHHNQMTIRNIAVCLAPSLFHSVHGHGNACSLTSSGTPNKPSVSPRRKKATGIPDAKELNATKASHDCLQFLIREYKTLFRVSQESLDKCNFNYMDQSIPLYREQLGADTNQNWLTYQYECTTALLKEARKESRGWVSFIHTFDPLVDVAYKKVGDGHPLRLWRVTTEVEAPPQEVLHSILNDRKVWDSSLIRSFVVERPEEHCDVFCYTTASMLPLPPREFCVLRSWRTDLNKGACCMVETSVKKPMTYTSPPGTPITNNACLGAITGVVLASRYFIEPCGSGRSKVMHLSRVDTKGRTLEFYTKIYGHICAAQLTNLRKAFVIKSEGPESKV